MNAPRFWTRRAIRWPIKLALWGVTILATVVLVFALQARARLPDLKAWHRIHLEHEFHAGDPHGPASFDEYRQLEERLIKEMRERVLDAPQAADTWQLGRYNPQSAVAHLALDTPYNHSFELAPAGE